MPKSKKILILIAVVIIVACLLIVLAYRKSTETNPAGNGSSTPLKDNGHGFFVTPSQQEQINRGNVVGALLTKLPYQGSFFSLDFDYKIGKFVLTLTPGYQQQGNQSFDLFLRANGIDDRSWLEPNLQIKTQ